MHNENPFPMGRVDCQSTREEQPTNGRLYQSQNQNHSHSHNIDLQRQRARRTALWVGAIAVLVYVGFILSGVIGR
ncbi:hypothetical protein [Stenotrophomonas sp. YAU14D1_LEIMI4_1]|uniref:hypothetical protein n=1 Tax=Stenotrophomonas sp. YAU14D1_LEIMI4_1 TaxID=2072407 RepID=UPI000D53C7C9|nr:hypothetical protein [Stenotrophomonas sp. YAU14D1_LEIMI4_1]AWH23948.1 hypothetical protein C1932_01830 [Stenotrophomonas sp. YAU14D1_LEIMI4_1]